MADLIPQNWNEPGGDSITVTCKCGQVIDLTNAQAYSRLQIAAARINELESALREWKCPSCGGSKLYTHRWRTNDGGGSEVVPCKVCEQTGLHPIASAALKKGSDK